MAGIPDVLYSHLRETLLECGPFDNDRQLRAVFANALLTPWRNRLPEETSPLNRVDAVIDFLLDKRRAETQTSALVLLLGVLRDRTDPQDECFARLNSLAEELAVALQIGIRPGPGAKGEALEANLENQRMIFTADWMKLLESVQAVGRMNVPKILHGQITEQFPSGTGWLVAPGLALTCWHVIKARGPFDGMISDTDLQSQTVNSVLTFDYILPGQGVEYRVAALECSDANLDYALLRLEDRSDHPLRKQGILHMDVNVPLTVQTTLYVIQHPKGQPQQNSAGRFIKYKIGQPSRILHSAPTEPGTSGAPVLNVTNWSVIALHNAENNDEQLREATLLSAILPDIQQKRPDLYSSITQSF
jgi:V8-like Glu-specific endopeptidase